MSTGGGKATSFLRANGVKTAKARSRILLQHPISLLPLVFPLVTVKSPFSVAYLHFEQVHLPATMFTPLLYTIKNNDQN